MNIIKWLLTGDISIQYRVKKELLGIEAEGLRNAILQEGYGQLFLSKRNADGHWGRGFYQPKWTSSHYTLLDLINLKVPSSHSIKKTIERIIEDYKAIDGGINPAKTSGCSDVCINGMCLNYMAYFGIEADSIKSIVDCIISQQMMDGGYNCQFKKSTTGHSSLHSTLSVLEGIHSYQIHGYTYKLETLLHIKSQCIEFILQHHLYKSDKTGKCISQSFIMLSYPSRWRFDILRCLEYFVDAKVEFDFRMKDALDVLKSKKRKDGTWTLQAKHKGAVHFDMEVTGKSSRWNTFRALKVLNYYDHDQMLEAVLSRVCKIFTDEKIRFAIGGSLLLKSYKLIEAVNDIDIIIHPEDLKKTQTVMDALGLMVENESDAAYKTQAFLEYNIDGIDIDIMVNMAMESETGVYVYPFVEAEITYVDKFNCENLPLLSLESWYVAYGMLGREDKVQMLCDYFKKVGVNQAILKSNLLLPLNKHVIEAINKLL